MRATIILCVLLVGVGVQPLQKQTQSQHPQKGQPTTQQKPQPAPTPSVSGTPCQQESTSCQGNTQKQAWNWKDAIAPQSLPDWFLVLVGVGGIIAATCTLRSINRQSRIMLHQTAIARHAANASKTSADAALSNAQTLVNSERPWLLLDKKMFPDRPHTWLELEIRIRNFGRTPAKVTAMQVDVRFGDSQDTPPQPKLFDKIEPFNPHVLPQGEELTYEIDATHSEGANQYPSKHLWVSGLVRYEDTFGSATPETHETLFCGHMVNYGGRHIWQRGPDKYNKAT